MAQSDLNIANGPGATVRADINSQLEALVTDSSGPTSPPVTFPFMTWVDTSGSPVLIKKRNGANTAWITLGEIVAGEFVPYSAGESAETRYARLAGGADADFTLMPQVGGSPIVERDSNSNGEYTRWADGTQVAVSNLISSAADAIGSGTYSAPWTTANLGWTFPVPFISSPVVLDNSYASLNNNDVMKVNMPSVSTTGTGSFRIVSLSNGTAGKTANTRLSALGYWK